MLTYDVHQSKEFTEEVSVRPPVVVLQVVGEVVHQELLILPLLDVMDHADVKVHLQHVDLADLPVFPKSPSYVEEKGLQREEKKQWIKTGFKNSDLLINIYF